jgi:hypothetical protein
VALALTTIGLYLAATDSNATTPAADPLNLHGKPPTSASIAYTLSSGGANEITGTATLDFRHDAYDVTATIPTGFTAARVEIRGLSDHLYIAIPSMASLLGAEWHSVALEHSRSLRRRSHHGRTGTGARGRCYSPGMHVSISGSHHNGHRQVVVRIPSIDLRRVNSHLAIKAAARIILDLGDQGQLIGLSATLTTATSTWTFEATVTAYNARVSIPVPPASDTKALTKDVIKQLFGSNAELFGSLLSPSTSPRSVEPSLRPRWPRSDRAVNTSTYRASSTAGRPRPPCSPARRCTWRCPIAWPSDPSGCCPS